MTLKISISGVRGITGKSLTDEIVADFSRAFAAYIKSGTVVIGRDTRASGSKISEIVASNLNKLGINVIDIGIAPTPTVAFMVKELKADGGMIITASHNPGEWNGLKFVRSDGIFLNESQANKLIHIYNTKRAGQKAEQRARKGKSRIFKNPFDAHIKRVLDSVDAAAIRKRRFEVVLDSCNGAGSRITVRLLKELGCQVVELYTNTDEPFPHDPEPIPGNLKALCEKVKGAKADVGFAQDADADRLAIVTEKGIAPGEEYTLAIAAEQILSNPKSEIRNPKSETKTVIVTNLSTSMMVDDIAKKYGAKVVRTKIGEVNVAEAMVKNKAVIGGEGNGGVMYPKVGYNRDSLIGIGLILDAIAASGKRISGIIDSMPKYVIVKDKVECGSKKEADSLINKVKSKFMAEKLNLTDGVKILLQRSWVHVRASNTEPVIRIIAEAENKEKALELAASIKSLA
jgi:phosphomannomutase